MSRAKVVRRTITAILAVIVAVYGGVWIYATFINDAPEALTTEDLSDALETPSNSGNATETTTVASEQLPQQWTITEGSEVGYRVAEVLLGVNTEGVGRTSDVTGSITLDGTTLTEASFIVDVASIRSDDGRRDGQFRGRIMQAEQFPTAEFTLSAPVELDVSAIDGAVVDIEIAGDLTMHGVTQPVTAQVSAQVEGGRIGLVGSIHVTFTDFDILDPSLAAVKVEPDGLIEFLLVLSR